MDFRTCLHTRGLHPSMIDWTFSAAYKADNARSNVIHCFDGYSLHGETQTCLSCVGCAQELVGWIKSGKVAEATRQVFAYIQSRLDGFDEERRLIEERRATQVVLSQMSAHSTVPHALLWHRATRTSHHRGNWDARTSHELVIERHELVITSMDWHLASSDVSISRLSFFSLYTRKLNLFHHFEGPG
jgi:hypothetical protein